MATTEITEASDPVGGEPMGYKEAWVESAFSTYKHHLDNYSGKWEVAFVEPNNGDSMSTEDARAYLAECLELVATAEKLTGEAL